MIATSPPARHAAPAALRLAQLKAVLGRAAADQRIVVALALLLAALPLLQPSFPPLIDLPNHMSRYRIGADFATSPYFHRWFDFHWVLVGNLGVDLLVTALAPLLGLEPATKLVVLAIPVLTVAGLALAAREVHGRIPATAAFAFAFAYNYPLNFGFVNFTLSAALALLAWGLWLRMGRLGQMRARAVLFVPLAFLVWLAHVAGWGMLGILVFASEVGAGRERGLPWWRAGVRAGIACLPLTVALVPMVAWVGSAPQAGMTVFGYSASRKLAILLLSLRNEGMLADVGAVCILWFVLTIAIVRPDLRYDRRLLLPAAAMLAAFLVMPGMLMGSYHADVRIAPYVLALFALALKPVADTRVTRAVSLLAILFFAGRIADETITYARLNHAQEHQLEALDHLPIGARVFAMANANCPADMAGNRLDHVHRMAIVRRQAFANGTWPPPGSQTLIVHPDMVAGYGDMDSQLLLPRDCRDTETHTVPGGLATVPRERYDYVWLLDVPPASWPRQGWLRPVWHNDSGILYRILSTPAPRLRGSRPG